MIQLSATEYGVIRLSVQDYELSIAPCNSLYAAHHGHGISYVDWLINFSACAFTTGAYPTP